MKDYSLSAVYDISLSTFTAWLLHPEPKNMPDHCDRNVLAHYKRPNFGITSNWDMLLVT